MLRRGDRAAGAELDRGAAAGLPALGGGGLRRRAVLGARLRGRRRPAAAAATALLLPGVTFPSLARGCTRSCWRWRGRRWRWARWTGWRPARARRVTCRPPRRAALLAAATAGWRSRTSAYAAGLLLVGGPWLAGALGPTGLRRAALAGLAAMAATAWFWAPMLLVAGEAQTGYLTEAHPYARSLWFGPRAGATELERSWATTNAFGQALGVAQLLLATALSWALRGRPKPPSLRILPAAIALVACASLHPLGDWLSAAPGFAHLQFAWRWQGPLALLCAGALAALPADRMLGPAAFAALVLAFAPLMSPPIAGPRASPPSASWSTSRLNSAGHAGSARGLPSQSNRDAAAGR